MRFLLMLCIALLFANVAIAINPDEVLKDPALETRARALSVDIRCLVCQNQSIDDSDADLAKREEAPRAQDVHALRRRDARGRRRGGDEPVLPLRRHRPLGPRLSQEGQDRAGGGFCARGAADVPRQKGPEVRPHEAVDVAQREEPEPRLL